MVQGHPCTQYRGAAVPLIRVFEFQMLRIRDLYFHGFMLAEFFGAQLSDLSRKFRSTVTHVNPVQLISWPSELFILGKTAGSPTPGEFPLQKGV
jgi:hypothetical protein